MRRAGEHRLLALPALRHRPAVLALAVGLASLALLPFVPVLPGLGSSLALALGGLLCRQPAAKRQWSAIAAVAAGGAGIALALTQLAAALAAAVGVGPW